MKAHLKCLSLLFLFTLATPIIARQRQCRSCPTQTTTTMQPSLPATPKTSYASVPAQPNVVRSPRPSRTSSAHVVELKPGQSLDDILNKNPNTVIYFYGTICEPCKWMRPHLEKVMPEYPHIKFVIINADDFPLLQLDYHLKGWPSLIVYKDGKQIVPIKDPKRNNELYEYLSGPRDENEIRTVLDMVYKK